MTDYETNEVVKKGMSIEDSISKELEECLPKMITARIEYDKKLRAWYRDWRDVKLEKVLPFLNSANFSVPLSSSASDAIVPRIVEGVLDHDTPVKATATTTQGEVYQDIFQEFVNWDVTSKDDIKDPLWLGIQDTVWSGTGWIENVMEMEKEVVEEEIKAYVIEGQNQPFMDAESGTPLAVTPENTLNMFEKRPNPEFDPQTMPPEAQFLPPIPYKVVEFTKKEKRWKKYEPVHKVLSIYDVLFNPDAESMQDVWDNGMLAIRQYGTKDFLKRMLKQDSKELYKRLDKVKIDDLQPNNTQDVEHRDWYNKLYEKSKKIEYYKVFMFADIDGDGIDEKIVCLYSLKSKQLFGWEKYPYKHGRCPVVPLYIHPIAGRVMGVGMCEKLYDTKGEIDFIHNSRSDRMALLNDPILMTTKSSGFNPSVHKRGFGRVWRLDSLEPSDLRYLETPKSEVDSYNSEEMVKMWAERVSSIDGRSSGVANRQDSNNTATGIASVIEEGNTKFRHYIRWIAKGVREILTQRYMLMRQYWGDEADEQVDGWVKDILDAPDNPLRGELQGENGSSIGNRFEALKQSFNLVLTASYTDKEMEYKRVMSAWYIVAQEPLYQQDYPAKLKVMEDVFRVLGFKDAKEKLPSLERIQQMQLEAEKEAQRQLMEEQAQAEEEAQFNEEKLKQLGALELSEGLRELPVMEQEQKKAVM